MELCILMGDIPVPVTKEHDCGRDSALRYAI